MTDRADTLSGSCLCGAVAFEFDGPLTIYRYCFCALCRKNRGTSHAANLLVGPGAYRWTKGEQNVRRYDMPGRRFGNCFCGTCGTPVPRLSLSGRSVIVPAGLLDGGPDVRPDHVVFWDARVPWLPSAEDLPKFSEFAD